MNQRYYSLDVFRGATVALMILVNNPGSWSHIFDPLKHADWHGCTPTDLVFPFFLFAVGNALAFVMPRFEQAGQAAFLQKVLKRTALIFLIGLLLHWSPFVKWQDGSLVMKQWGNVRIMGVLQRIALCYGFAALIVYYFKTKGAFVFSTILLIAYWLLSYFLGDATDPYSMQGFFGTQRDIDLFGVSHIYMGEGVPFDPEGLFSTPAAVVQVVFGYFTGQYIQQKGKNYEMLSNLFVAGLILIFAGLCWGMVFPINKKIWTSSYTLYTTGLAMVVIGIMIYLIEFKEARGAWSRFFDVFGKNPLFIFVLSGFLPRLTGLLRWSTGVNAETGETTYTSFFPWFYNTFCKNIAEDLRVGSLLYALLLIIFYWAICYLLDKKKIYIKV